VDYNDILVITVGGVTVDGNAWINIAWPIHMVRLFFSMLNTVVEYPTMGQYCSDMPNGYVSEKVL